MYCTNCGAENPDSARFCTQCGNSVQPDHSAAGSHRDQDGRRRIYQEEQMDQYQQNDGNEHYAEPQPAQGCCPKNYAVPAPYDNLDWSFLPPTYQGQFSRIRGSDGLFVGSFNWAACLFSSLWLLTKGCWLAAVVYAAIIMLAHEFVAWIIPYGNIIVWAVVSVLIGFRGTYIYYMACVRNQQVIW